MIRIALCDDEALVATSLATLLGLEEDFEIAQVCASGEELVEWWRREHSSGGAPANVVVCDLQLGGIDGVETARRLFALSPAVRVVIVTSHARPAALKRALDAGVTGFLPKTSDAREFAAAIRTVHAGRRYIDPETAALTISASDSPLTDRERQLLELAGKGLSIDDIASAAFLAPGTCRNYLSNAMAKVGASNRFEAFTLAREKGWI